MQYPYQNQYQPLVLSYPVAFVPARGTNGMAVASFICSLVLCPLFFLGIIFGHIALSQIARTGEDGRGLAIAGLVISYVCAAFVVLWFLMPFFGFALL
ncbi:DUF4190 domain-containing protein [Mycolicibacterium novocastrense]|nr:DUF4190 domain-containing protein [Mycolicibacterium novocastrense]